MRVLGFLLLSVVALPVFAGENPIRLAFARFAYADSSAFHNSFTKGGDAPSTSIEKRLPYLPLDVFGKEQLVDKPPEATIPLVKTAEAKPPAPARLKSAQIAPSPATPVAIAPVPVAKALSPEPPPTVQRVAALPEPMRLLPKGPTAEIAATEAEPVVPTKRPHAAPKPSKTRARTAKPKPSSSKQARAQPTPKSKDKSNPAKIPRWARQLFDSNNWQTRTFSYQR